MSTVMILGAGVPRAAGRKRPLKRRPPLDRDFFEVARAGKYRGYHDVIKCLESLVGESPTILTQSLETAATYLYLKAIDSSSWSKYHTGFLRFLILLNSVLSMTTNTLPRGHSSLVYRFLLNELNKLEDPSELTIITFNYDLVIENVLDEIVKNGRPGVFVFPGCYRIEDYATISNPKDQQRFLAKGKEFNGVGVLKLHGSMNWQSLHTSRNPKTNALFNPKRELHIINSKKISTNLVWKRKKRTGYLKPIITPPISGKRGMMHASTLKLWNRAADKLRGADRIVIAGYSCPPLDLEARILLSENLHRNQSKKVHVIDPDPKSASKFFDLCGVNHATIHLSIQSWLDDIVD